MIFIGLALMLLAATGVLGFWFSAFAAVMGFALVAAHTAELHGQPRPTRHAGGFAIAAWYTAQVTYAIGQMIASLFSSGVRASHDPPQRPNELGLPRIGNRLFPPNQNGPGSTTPLPHAPITESLLPRSRSAEAAPEPPHDAAPGDGRFPHALLAARRAGLQADAPVLPEDIGFIVYDADETMALYRDQAIPSGAAAIQPYLRLRLPRPLSDVVQFEVYDSVGRPVFVHASEYTFIEGSNLIIAQRRLPLARHSRAGTWELRVTAGSETLAIHEVTWYDAASTIALVRQHLATDGEIMEGAEAVLAQARTRLSLDDLLETGDAAGKPADTSAAAPSDADARTRQA